MVANAMMEKKLKHFYVHYDFLSPLTLASKLELPVNDMAIWWSPGIGI
jgi:hypothetical protein